VVTEHRRGDRVATRIAGVLLAAGSSTSSGRPKQLAPCRGTTLVRAMSFELCESSCDLVGVIAGAHSDDVLDEGGDLELVIVPNPLWQEGVASSIRVAVLWAVINRADALALCACNQPRLSRQHVDALCGAHRLTHRSVASLYGNTITLPAVFDKHEFPK